MKEIKIIITELKRDIRRCKSNKCMESASWGYEEGILISGNQAETIVNALTATTPPPSKKHLRELAEDREACEEIAKLVDFAFSSAKADDDKVTITFEEDEDRYELCIYQNGNMFWDDPNAIPRCIQIALLISRNYTIGEI